MTQPAPPPMISVLRDSHDASASCAAPALAAFTLTTPLATSLAYSRTSRQRLKRLRPRVLKFDGRLINEKQWPSARSWGWFGPGGEHMPRPLQRVRLESGLKLNLNALAQRGVIRPGAYAGPVGIAWTNSHTGEQFASGLITAEMSGRYDG